MLNNSDSYKTNIYALLDEMSENINKLFSSLDMQVEDNSDLQIPPRIIALIESLVNNGGMVAKNLQLLNGKLKSAFDKSEEIRLINWASGTNLKELQSEISKMKQEISGLKKQHMDSIMSLINLRDSILMKEGLAGSQGESKLQAAMVSMLQETANMLEKNDIIILDEKGVFNSSKQTVVDVQETEDETLHNTIASVFRPGYSFVDEMIRPQEVVLYKYKRS